jgi:hypothetical protein
MLVVVANDPMPRVSKKFVTKPVVVAAADGAKEDFGAAER